MPTGDTCNLARFTRAAFGWITPCGAGATTPRANWALATRPTVIVRPGSLAEPTGWARDRVRSTRAGCASTTRCGAGELARVAGSGSATPKVITSRPVSEP